MGDNRNLQANVLSVCKIFRISLLLICFTVPACRSGESVAPDPESPTPVLDTVSYDIQLEILPDRYIWQDVVRYDLEARTKLVIRNAGSQPVDTVHFYLHPEFRIDTLCESGKDLSFEMELIRTKYSITQSLRKIEVKCSQPLVPDETQTFDFEYKGWIHPTGLRTIEQESFSDLYVGITEEMTFLRGLFYALWVPMVHFEMTNEAIQDLASYRLTLDIPERLQPLAFGALLSEEVKNGRNVSVWETFHDVDPVHPCLMLDRWKRGGSPKFRLYYHDSPESEKAAQAFDKIGQQLKRFFDQHYSAGLKMQPEAPYILAEIGTFAGVHAGQNNVGLSQTAFRNILSEDKDERYAVLVWLAHEMVQEYVCTMVDTKRTGAAAIWDPFALYFNLPPLWEVLGEDFEKWDLEHRWWAYEQGLKTGKDRYGQTLPPEKPLAEIGWEEYSEHFKDRWLTSDKEQIVLRRLQKHIIDAEAGEGTFMKTMSEYFGRYRTKPATIDDFREALEKASGLDLKEFFQRWFFTTQRLPEDWKMS